MFCFQLCQTPVQTRFRAEIVTNTDIAKTRNIHRGMMTERYREKKDKVVMLLLSFFHWLFSFSQFTLKIYFISIK